ncbi:2-dehydropantoate 2-reductase (Ketopantoate reductase) (KPA reductase) (KPR) [Entomophthora muscae]|uniref:2-dehydropantoate 2-reductase (Ketopantoate reductase) (KPA reductase) (KPR) n=1 Tax=Entomophthora muscae TaxID=34485 RepID=A0ACC2U9P6_9FUNG|nr:2-dehydropantoate 2-reductase (Ketopantoate reductase) (KPA reductase) (KPR) [Entomophthora muscae]
MYHILGAGAVGCLIALKLHQVGLRTALIFKSKVSLNKFLLKGASIEINEKDNIVTIHGLCGESADEINKKPIRNLIVTTKSTQTRTALEPLLGRINSETRVIFLQNGLGVLDEVMPLLCQRMVSQIVLGSVTHGCYRLSNAPFKVFYPSPGGIWLGMADNRVHPLIKDCSTPSDLWGDLQMCKALNCQTNLTPESVIEILLRKLTMNVCINPLASLLGRKNGAILENPESLERIDKICHEVAGLFPFLFPKITKPAYLYDPQALKSIVVECCTLTKDNHCSMLQDISAKRSTEIDYLNGYIVRQCTSLNLDCETNCEVYHQIKKLEANSTSH